MTITRSARLAVVTGGLLVGLTTLPALQSVPLQGPAPPLTGRVTSAAEGAMERVLVSARREGSNVTVTVVSNASGAYTFPQARLQPGRYSITIRAGGYVLPATKAVDVTSTTTTVDLRLEQASILEKALQLTSPEWLHRRLSC